MPPVEAIIGIGCLIGLALYLVWLYRPKKGNWIERLKMWWKKRKEKPSCYGHYFDTMPTAARNRKRGCDKCTYWSYEPDSCLVISNQRMEQRGTRSRSRKSKGDVEA